MKSCIAQSYLYGQCALLCIRVISVFFRMHPHIHCTLSLILSVENSESLYHRLLPGMSRKCMCGVDGVTLHGSTSSLRRRVGGCVPLEGTIAPDRDPFKRPTYPCIFRATIDLLG